MSVYDDEIDLRPYIFALRRRWWLIALITTIAAGAAFAFTIIRDQKYEASATILLTRRRTSLSIADQFPTINEPIDNRSRMEAMIAIAGSDALMLQALDDIHAEHPDNGLERGEFKEAVEISSTGDTIKIAATYTDPVYAAAIANAVAQNAVTAINYAYSGEQLPGEIQSSLDPARIEYQDAQTNLEDYLEDNQITLLEKQIEEVSVLLDELVQDRNWQITYNIQRRQKMQQIVDQAAALKEQLRTDKDSTAASLGDALAALRLHAEAFGIIPIDREVSTRASLESKGKSTDQQSIVSTTRQSDMTYDVQITQLLERIESGQEYQADLEKIIELAEEEKEMAEANLLLLTQQSLDVEGADLLISASERLRKLQSEFEKENAFLNELTSQRDISWEAYQALAQKETEVRNNLQTSSSVTFASPAVPPIEPTGRGTLLNTAIGAAIGFFVSIIWILGAEWLKTLENNSKSSQHT
jgi:uncharacterized protein involved in exopolysaccharide biosynthesis